MLENVEQRWDNIAQIVNGDELSAWNCHYLRSISSCPSSIVCPVYHSCIPLMLVSPAW